MKRKEQELPEWAEKILSTKVPVFKPRPTSFLGKVQRTIFPVKQVEAEKEKREERIARGEIPAIAKFLPTETQVRVGAIGAIRPLQVVGKAINIRLDKLDTTDDALKLIDATAKQYKGTINEWRRETITHAETERLADQLGMSARDLLKFRKGQAFNAEQAFAARDILTTSAQETATLAKRATAENSDQALSTFRASLERHIAIQKSVSGITAEAGRALSQFKMVAKAGAPLDYQRTLKILGGREVNEEIARRLASIDPSDTLALARFIREVQKVSKKDQVYEIWVNSLLSSPTTHIVNNSSNALVRALRTAEKGVSAGIDVIRSKVTGTPRERFVGEVPADVYGAVHGVPEGIRKAIWAYQNELPGEGVKLEAVHPAAIKGLKGKIIRTPGRALTAEDQFFKTMNFQAQLHTLAYRDAAKAGLKGNAFWNRVAELQSSPTKEMVEKAGE
ncbi:MAG: hypothetical protein AABZ55_02115, partial [Bdellovibrionota bacterium]